MVTRANTDVLDSLLHALPFSWTDMYILDAFDTKENRRLTKEYPHDCFNKDCKGSLSNIDGGSDYGPLKLKFQDVMKVNPSIPHDELIKLWKSPHVQFYCCSCKRDLEITEVDPIALSILFHVEQQLAAKEKSLWMEKE